MLSILTWLWSQPAARYRYTAHDVNVWAAMVSRHLTLPHRLACVTDMPEGIDPSIDIIPLPDVLGDLHSTVWTARHHDGPQCWRRLHLWHPDAAQWYGERFVSMDLDCVITGSLDPLFDRREDVVLYRGTSAKRPYNGSMLLMTAGARPQVFLRATQAEVNRATNRYIGSDQALISYVLGRGEATWGKADGVEWFRPCDYEHRGARPPSRMRVMFFPGPVKPVHVADRLPFVGDNYRL